MTEEPQVSKSPQPRPGRLTRLHDWLSFWLGRVLIVGPDAAPTSTKAPSVAIAQASVSSVTTDRTPADTKTKSDESSVWDTVLSWPVRLLLVGLVFVVGRIWHNEPVGIQLGWGLQYGLLLAVSIVASCWFYVGLVNLVAAGVWVLFSWNPDVAPQRDPPRWVLADYITWLNRQIGHIEVLATWIALALVWSHSLPWQLLRLAVIAFLGKSCINGIARTKLLGGGEPAAKSRAVLLLERRRVIYAATLIGMFLLVMQAPHQWRTTFPLWLTVLPGLGVRWLRDWRRRHLACKSEEFLRHRKDLAELQYKKAAATGWMGPTAVAAALVGVIALSLWHRNQLRGAARQENDGPAPPSNACVAESGGPLSPTLALFLIADTHIHELGGQRFPGQMEIVNAIMSVSRRPVELDMLSSAPMIRFATVFDRIVEERKDRQLPAPLWAHLGDFSNFSCVSEMDRALALVKHYGAGGRMLAGFAPGSHDMSFHGNFDWSPYWDTACVPTSDNDSSIQRLDKARMDPRLASVLRDRLVAGNTSTGLSGLDMTRLSPNRPLSRFTITRLGTLPVDASPGRLRGVMGVFLDTTDRATPNYGIAGAVGSFSSQQGRAILKQIELAKADAASPAASSPEAQAWADPWFVLMGHSPYRELSPSSREALNALIMKLDRPQGPCQPPDEGCNRPRVLALLAAHVHTAGSHRHCVGSRLLREIVIGSTLDPPEQAALLEIGLDDHKRVALRVSSVPTIARPGFVCSSAYAVSAARCRKIVADLVTSPDCTDLVTGWSTQGSSDTTCEELERPLSLTEKIRGIALHGGPDDEKALAATETQRGRALLRCVCRNVGQDLRQACVDAYQSPLQDKAYAAVLEALSRDPGRQDELTCLAWAASAVQQHKSNGMSMSDALRCSFDDPTLQPAQVVTATAEEVPCY